MIDPLFKAADSAPLLPSKPLDLPPDVWIDILSYSTAHELARMLRISSTWRTNALAPCLWKDIIIEDDDPSWHLVALRSFFARAHNTPVAIEIRTNGQNANPSDITGGKTGAFELLQKHVSHIRALNLRVYDIISRFGEEEPLEDITGPEYSALRSFLRTPMPVLETFSIQMCWDVLSDAVPQPFNANAPNLRTVKLLFQGEISQIPDTSILPQAQSWKFQRQDYPLVWPWDWNDIWVTLSSRGYFSKREVLFTAQFSSGGDDPDMTDHTIFDKWKHRQLAFGRSPTWFDTGAEFALDSSPLPVRARLEFTLLEHCKAALEDAVGLRFIEHLALHDTYEWSFDSNRPTLPPIPPTPMPSLKTLTINCMTPFYPRRDAKYFFKLLQPGAIEVGRRIVAPNLEEVRVQRWVEEAAKTVTIDVAWLVNFLKHHVENSSTRFKRITIGIRKGLELKQGQELGALASLADIVQVC